MTPLFTAADYAALAALVFRDDYPGNATARGVVEAPNGDPAALDTGKKFAHVAMKYLEQMPWSDDKDLLQGYLEYAASRAYRLALQWYVPSAYRPRLEFGCLRVLEYPVGVGASAVHTDMDLFTLNLYRNVPNPGLGELGAVHLGELGELVGLGPATPHHVTALAEVQRSIVYFAIPDHAALLGPNGRTVGDWLQERHARSRYTTPTTKAATK
jgi:hypothetical protein